MSVIIAASEFTVRLKILGDQKAASFFVLLIAIALGKIKITVAVRMPLIGSPVTMCIGNC